MTRRESEPKPRPKPNSLSASRQRHRGELREQVLSVARAMLASDGFASLSMRELARQLGCAPMSLYAHFHDKHDLLLALAHESFDALAVSFAAERANQPVESLRKLYLAYARLGLEKPDDYRILFMTPESQPPRERKVPAEISRENAAFAVSLDRVSACVTAGLIRGDVHAIATLLWTTVHGAVAAMLTFPAFPFGNPDAYIAQVVDLVIVAVRARHIGPLETDVSRPQPS